jgi:hypothetical protein
MVLRKRKLKTTKPADHTDAKLPLSFELPETYTKLPTNIIDKAIKTVSLDLPFETITQSNLICDESKIKPGFTEKGAISYSSSGSHVLDLFFSSLIRNTDKATLHEKLTKAWNEDPVSTVQCILNARDCRAGKGERKVAFDSMMWLREHKQLTYLLNLQAFLNIGCYKDLLQLAAKANTNIKKSHDENDTHVLKLGGTNDLIELELFAHDILNSKQSLAAKWAPSEGSLFDKEQKMAHRIAKLMFPQSDKPKELYRKELSRLRKQLNVVETHMCNNKWHRINYSAVPSKAHLLHKQAFRKHEPERYQKYLEKLAKGEEKINSTGLQPHELVGAYLKNGALDATIEAQWKDMIDKLQKQGTFENTISVIDVSGSMTGQPMEVAIALGLITSTLTKGPFHNYCINFDTTPIWHKVKGETLQEKVTHMKSMPWGMSTNIEGVFNLILNVAQSCKLEQKYMPKTLFIFSDMQFNQADKNFNTAYQNAKRKFKQANYICPHIVFWNLRPLPSDGGIPVSIKDNGTALISGFSAELLKQFLNNPSNISPIQIMLSILEKYNAKVCSLDL